LNASRWILLVGLGTTLGAGLGLGAHAVVPEAPYARGVFVGGRQLPRGESAASWLAERRVLSDQTVFLRAAGEVYERRLDQLGVEVDVPATLARAGEVAHRGGLVQRLKESRAARRGEVDVPLVVRLSEPRATAELERIAAALRREPVDARLDLVARTKHPEVLGRELDLDLALEALRTADFERGLVVVDLPTRPIPARVTLDDLAAVDVSKTLSSFETKFHTWGEGIGRSANITRAASLIDGVILPPGQVLSFNELVGPRTLERGFTWAPEIQGDELTTGVGGGTCQVSTTLFAAALHGAMEIVERRSHSRPSSYTKLGLDATVSYPSVDLKLKNPFSFPVMIHAYLPEPGRVRVEILGAEPLAEVSYTYGIGHAEDFVRRVTVKPHFPPGKRLRKQKGGRGYDVTSIATIKWKDGRTEQRTFFSGYRPTPEVYWVAPGYDEAELPPLPDHAKGVEGRLADGRGDGDLYSTM